MTRVTGVGTRDTVTVVRERLATERVLRTRADGQNVTLWWQPGQRSALDNRIIDQGHDVGQTGAFVPISVDGRPLTFSPASDGGFVDDQTGSRWSILGHAVSGPQRGTRLTPVHHTDTFWFTWSTFHPQTRVIG
ncbi:MAG: DUF3179 domain-containing (seleno)protein [Euzebya sp.]